MRRYMIVTAGLLVLSAVPAAAQMPGPPRLGIGIAPHVGSLGIGADVAIGGVSALSVRAGANFFPFDVDVTESDIEYTISLPTTQFTLLVDVATPVGFRATGGVLISTGDIVGTGQLLGSVDIGDATYPASEVGTLTGTITNKDLAPYLGIGWGKPAASRFGFFLDLGVAFHGAPSVTLTADGPIATDPLTSSAFLTDLATEQASLEDDLSWFTVYPVVSVGFSIGL